jgi:hypothetical protein
MSTAVFNQGEKEMAAQQEMSRQKMRDQSVHSDVYGLVDIL